MKYLFLIIPFLFIGCTKQKEKNANEITVASVLDIAKEDRKEVAEFILQCAKNANPLSDEEGEDLVLQCDKTADGIYGIQRYKICVGRCWEDYKWCDDAVLKNEIKACIDNGWVNKK